MSCSSLADGDRLPQAQGLLLSLRTQKGFLRCWLQTPFLAHTPYCMDKETWLAKALSRGRWGFCGSRGKRCPQAPARAVQSCTDTRCLRKRPSQGRLLPFTRSGGAPPPAPVRKCVLELFQNSKCKVTVDQPKPMGVCSTLFFLG